jgi:hypothetical protein
MASQESSKSIDVQKLLTGAAKIELKLIQSGVEALQVYMNQASRFSNLAGDTLQAVQDDKATLADTARKLTDFGRQSVKAYVELAQKMGAAYYDELDRLAGKALKTESNAAAPATDVSATTSTIGPAMKTLRPNVLIATPRSARGAKGKVKAKASARRK